MAAPFETGPEPGGRICVVDAGFMGCVIAVIYLRHGYEVVIHDVVPSMLDSFAGRAAPIAAQVRAEGEDPAALLSGARLEPSLERAVEGAFLVHEVVQEDLSVKRDLHCSDAELKSQVRTLSDSIGHCFNKRSRPDIRYRMEAACRLT